MRNTVFPLQKFCNIVRCPYYVSNVERSTRAHFPMKTLKFSVIWHFPIRELFHVHFKSSRYISLGSTINEMNDGKFRIYVTTEIAQNPCGEWRLMSENGFFVPDSTVSSTALMLYFLTFPYENCLFTNSLSAFTFLTYSFEAPCNINFFLKKLRKQIKTHLLIIHKIIFL